MKTYNGRYETGEPRENALKWVVGGYIAVIVIALISYLASGYGGALAAFILMLIRLGFFLAIWVGLGMMVWGLVRQRSRLMRRGFLIFLVGLVGFLILALLALIF